MTAFRDEMLREQLAWKARRLPFVTGPGCWQGRQYDHILPPGSGEHALWPGIRAGGLRPLPDYLDRHGIQPHKGRDNLLSSWTLCANLYFPFGAEVGLRPPSWMPPTSRCRVKASWARFSCGGSRIRKTRAFVENQLESWRHPPILVHFQMISFITSEVPPPIGSKRTSR